MNLKEQRKAESREKILAAASQLFCSKGFHATGVDELMEKAGLTAGAFYAHFKSKKALLRETLVFAMGRNRKRLFQGTEKLVGLPLIEKILEVYVSEPHRDHPEAGCPLPAVGPELHRHSKETSELVSGYLEKLVDGMTPHLTGKETERRTQALQILSQAVGAILLSRMTGSSPLSNEILRAGRKVP